jgi:ATP/maltotriose-dependent transcriptional regulator MalT
MHMRILYQKWGVNNRRKLIQRARELNLHEP